MNAFIEKELIEQATNSMASLAFVFPLTPGKAEERRSWGQEILGHRRSGVPTFFPPKIPAKAPARSRTGLNEAGSPGAWQQRKRYARPFSLTQ